MFKTVSKVKSIYDIPYNKETKLPSIPSIKVKPKENIFLVNLPLNMDFNESTIQDDVKICQEIEKFKWSLVIRFTTMLNTGLLSRNYVLVDCTQIIFSDICKRVEPYLIHYVLGIICCIFQQFVFKNII